MKKHSKKRTRDQSITIILDAETIDNDLALKILTAFSDECQRLTGSRLKIASCETLPPGEK